MIDINDLRRCYEQNKIIISVHAQERLRQRNIKQKDIMSCVMTGEIIEQYPEDFPFPSCLIFGRIQDGRVIHVVMSYEGTFGRIITAYIPNTEKFKDDLKTRRC